MVIDPDESESSQKKDFRVQKVRCGNCKTARLTKHKRIVEIEINNVSRVR